MNRSFTSGLITSFHILGTWCRSIHLPSGVRPLGKTMFLVRDESGILSRQASIIVSFEGTVRKQAVVWAFVLCLQSGVLGNLWAQSSNQPEPSRRMDPPASSEMDENQARLARDMAKRANQERQAAVRNDTEKLLKLARELKDYVDKTNENVLSLDVMKKAEEIEKLAHSVKEKMKASN